MGADTEAIRVEVSSGLQNHVESFHAKGAAKSMRTEVENIPAEKQLIQKIMNNSLQAPSVRKQQSKMVGITMTL